MLVCEVMPFCSQVAVQNSIRLQLLIKPETHVTYNCDVFQSNGYEWIRLRFFCINLSLKRSNIGVKLLWTKYSITRVHIHLEGISKLEKVSTPNDIMRHGSFDYKRAKSKTMSNSAFHHSLGISDLCSFSWPKGLESSSYYKVIIFFQASSGGNDILIRCI